MTGRDFVLFINGGYGTGKTSALDHIGDRLETTVVTDGSTSADVADRVLEAVGLDR